MNKTAYLLAFALTAALAGSGCKGDLNLSTGPTGGSQNNGGNNGGPTIDPFPDVPCEGIACDDPVVQPTDGAVRLTHTQWENSVRDLLKLDARPELSRSFIKDTLNVGYFDRLSSSLNVQPDLWDDYREAAEVLAAQIVANPDQLARLVPVGVQAPEAQLRAFLESFGLRAFRRPLTTEETDQYLALAAQADTVFGITDAPFEKRAELILRAILQSPYFLYRVESTMPAAGQVAALSGYEKASRLSFALWNSIPDEALLEAAKNGGLDTPEGVTTQAKRLLADARSIDMVLDFHGQILEFSHFDEMTKDAERFPDFNPNTAPAMREELESFITHVIHDSNGGYRELITSRVTYVNAELAGLYGIEPPTEEFGEVTLPEGERSGLLTRLGFLATNATPYDPNPIHRGKFINKHVLCNVVPPPPDMFSIPDGVAGNTNRERIQNATGECGGSCHTPLLNPAGFAFESYDAVGKWRTMDGDYPVDTTGTLPFGNQLTEFTGALDLSAKIAESPNAHECYVRHWFEYLHQRVPTAGDAPLIAKVAQVSMKNDLPIHEIIVGLLVNDLFLKRASEAP